MTLKLVLLPTAAGVKLVPVIVTAAPESASVGEKPVMVGAAAGVADTTKLVPLGAEPAGAVTAITPLVAPDGTVTTIWVLEALVTLAAVPLNVTAFRLGVALKPVP